tara:strand:- start:64 stop:570 length:507 start_codon:yes stop_codon:yes gene_type:complete
MDKIYFKIKYILLEYDEILKLDKEYLSIFLNECINELNLNENNYTENNELIDDKDEKIIYKNIGNNDCKKLYKKLAKKLHPDKNPTKKEEFIEISKAYETNDFIKLFMLCYENNIKLELLKTDIKLIEDEIIKKENEIIEIKNKIHWKWIECESELDKELLKQHIINL